MKKNFIIPEIRFFELDGEDVVMASAIAVQNPGVDYSRTDFCDTIAAEYNMWRGSKWNQSN